MISSSVWGTVTSIREIFEEEYAKLGPLEWVQTGFADWKVAYGSDTGSDTRTGLEAVINAEVEKLNG